MVLKEYLPGFIHARDEQAYEVLLLSLIARIHDTHANILGLEEGIEKFWGINFAPFGKKFVENKLVITWCYDDELARAVDLQRGDVLERINGKSVDSLVKERLPYASASNYPAQLRVIATHVLRTNDTVLTLDYSRDHSPMQAKVACGNPDQFKNTKPAVDSCFKIIKPGVAYLYPGLLKRGQIKKITPRILASQALIVDMRCYPSQYIVYSLGKYLVPKNTEFVKFSRVSIRTPGLFLFNNPLKLGRKKNTFYKGKVIILVNELTQSQAEYATMALRKAPGALVIGSTTAGADGDVSIFYLPGGIRTMISGLGVYYPDGQETQRVGIIPDIEVKPTLKGIKEGRDELMEKAMQILKGL